MAPRTGLSRVQLWMHPNVEQILEGHVRYANVRGIRHAINWHPGSYQDLRRPDQI